MIDDQRVQQIEGVGAPAQQPERVTRQEARKHRPLADQSPVKQRNGKRDQKVVDQEDGGEIERSTPIDQDHRDCQNPYSRKSRGGALASRQGNRTLSLDPDDDQGNVDAGKELQEIAEEGGR